VNPRNAKDGHNNLEILEGWKKNEKTSCLWTSIKFRVMTIAFMMVACISLIRDIDYPYKYYLKKGRVFFQI